MSEIQFFEVACCEIWIHVFEPIVFWDYCCDLCLRVKICIKPISLLAFPVGCIERCFDLGHRDDVEAHIMHLCRRFPT